jgi:hypothetical protein
MEQFLLLEGFEIRLRNINSIFFVKFPKYYWMDVVERGRGEKEQKMCLDLVVITFSLQIFYRKFYWILIT